MKLKNKKTGAIYSIEDIDLGNNEAGIWLGMTLYKSLAELNAEWEDYEELIKPYWFVNDLDGKPMKCDLRNCGKANFTEWGKYRKEIGNYFETKEEAERAVEKLKAWKRLKDKGFKFECRHKPNYGEKFIIECSLPKETLVIDVTEDLDFLFGGVE